MKIDVTDETKNPLFARREVHFTVSYSGPTPKLSEVRKELCGALKAEGDLLVVEYVKSEFGKTSAKGFAKVYENLEARGVEPEYLITRNFDRKRKKKEGGGDAPAEGGGEAPAEGGEAKPEGGEDKAEDKKEESKPEVKEDAGEPEDGKPEGEGAKAEVKKEGKPAEEPKQKPKAEEKEESKPAEKPEEKKEESKPEGGDVKPAEGDDSGEAGK